jgi:glucose-6-phosphate isomerase
MQEFNKLGLTDETLITERHFCACSTNFKELSKFKINKDNVFVFWDFVGGRFSVWSCIGILPLSIHFG